MKMDPFLINFGSPDVQKVPKMVDFWVFLENPGFGPVLDRSGAEPKNLRGVSRFLKKTFSFFQNENFRKKSKNDEKTRFFRVFS